MRTGTDDTIRKTLQTAAAFARRAEVDLKIGIDELNKGKGRPAAETAIRKALSALNEATNRLEDFLHERA